MIINAKEAREIAANSDAWLEAELKKIEPDIKKAAELNKSPCQIHIGSIGPWDEIKLTNAQIRIIEALKKLGYHAKIEKYGAPYVPRGLSDDDGNGPSHTNYGYFIHF